ncbi:hypothetical protein [Corynebacterium sp.]|uniref:hypothetical protein n=1 Tax=Corynebacterium sp. TaxID=1720 RepID=UPI003734CC37
MSDNDKPLTVAELLARAGKENPGDSERPRRRRRRSLEEGGISVAELTGSFRKVDARPEEAKHSSVPIDEPEPAEAEKPEKAEEPAKADKPDETTVMKKVDDEAVDEAPVATPVAPEKSAVSEKPAAPAKPSAQDMDETSVMPAVEDEDPAGDVHGDSVAVDESTEVREGIDADYDDDYYDEDEEDYDDDLNIPALVGMILGGLVLGVAVFFGFEWLWANLNSFLVAVLAIVVTVVMVGVVKALRTQKDGLMMTLAGIVGLLMTFGPAAVTLL